MRFPLFPALMLFSLLAGCHGGPAPSSADSSRAKQQEQIESQRTELALIPPPSKTRYLAVRNLDSWENPYLTIQPDMVTLHVMLADANPQAYGAGGLMRPAGARRQDLNISLAKLGEGLAAVPPGSWPYGRVIAVEEAHNTPAAGQPKVRRTLEGAVKTLNDLGIVVYEWNETGPK